MAYFQQRGDIKVGVVGYGGAFNMGRWHLNFMREVGMTPVAVAELDAERRAAAAEEFSGIATFPNVEAMLAGSDVDLVTIITPHKLHHPLAMACLEAGRHVVIEKPMALSTAQCDELIETAQRKDVMLSTYHNRHWDDSILNARRMILDEGLIGDVYKIHAHWYSNFPTRNWWRNSMSMSGGLLFDWGVHLLEFAFQILGKDARMREVSGYAVHKHPTETNPFEGDAVEAEAEAHVRFEDGRWLELSISALDHHRRKEGMEFSGSKGTYILNYHEWTILQRGPEGLLRKEGKNQHDANSQFYQNIAAHLVEDEPLVITPEWARRPIHVIDLAMQSAREGRALPARYP